jgi:hypothetical protein
MLTMGTRIHLAKALAAQNRPMDGRAKPGNDGSGTRIPDYAALHPGYNRAHGRQ